MDVEGRRRLLGIRHVLVGEGVTELDNKGDECNENTLHTHMKVL